MQIMAAIVLSRNAAWNSSHRMRTDCVIVVVVRLVKMICTRKPRDSRQAFPRARGVGRMSLRRAEGEIKAIVSPLFKALGIIVSIFGALSRYCNTRVREEGMVGNLIGSLMVTNVLNKPQVSRFQLDIAPCKA